MTTSTKKKTPPGLIASVKGNQQDISDASSPVSSSLASPSSSSDEDNGGDDDESSECSSNSSQEDDDSVEEEESCSDEDSSSSLLLSSSSSSEETISVVESEDERSACENRPVESSPKAEKEGSRQKIKTRLFDVANYDEDEESDDHGEDVQHVSRKGASGLKNQPMAQISSTEKDEDDSDEEDEDKILGDGDEEEASEVELPDSDDEYDPDAELEDTEAEDDDDDDEMDDDYEEDELAIKVSAKVREMIAKKVAQVNEEDKSTRNANTEESSRQLDSDEGDRCEASLEEDDANSNSFQDKTTNAGIARETTLELKNSISNEDDISGQAETPEREDCDLDAAGLANAGDRLSSSCGNVRVVASEGDHDASVVGDDYEHIANSSDEALEVTDDDDDDVVAAEILSDCDDGDYPEVFAEIVDESDATDDDQSLSSTETYDDSADGTDGLRLTRPGPSHDHCSAGEAISAVACEIDKLALGPRTESLTPECDKPGIARNVEDSVKICLALPQVKESSHLDGSCETIKMDKENEHVPKEEAETEMCADGEDLKDAVCSNKSHSNSSQQHPIISNPPDAVLEPSKMINASTKRHNFHEHTELQEELNAERGDRADLIAGHKQAVDGERKLHTDAGVGTEYFNDVESSPLQNDLSCSGRLCAAPDAAPSPPSRANDPEFRKSLCERFERIGEAEAGQVVDEDATVRTEIQTSLSYQQHPSVDSSEIMEATAIGDTQVKASSSGNITEANSSACDTSDDAAPSQSAAFVRPTGNRDRSVKPGCWTRGARIGSGAFGVVHVGMNTQTGTLMAVKSIQVSRAVMKDIRREVNLLRSLQHKNIVRYLGAEMSESHLHIFQEWVPGGSVEEMLSKFGPFSVSVVRSYLSQLLDGLIYLHANEIMHRDIKGSNLLVSDDGVVKLADFGASKRLKSDSMLKNTMVGSKYMRQPVSRATLKEINSSNDFASSAPYFMAPEVFEEYYSFAADIWSVGCVAFQMVTGSPPWKDLKLSNPVALFRHVKQHDGPPPIHPTRLTGYGEEAIARLNSFQIRCFHLEPSSRPTASNLRKDAFFIETHCWSGGNQSPLELLFSPGSESSFEDLRSPTPLHSPSPRRVLRSNSISSRPSPRFLSPPLPRQSTSRKASPQLDTSDWPTWGRECHGVLSAGPKLSRSTRTPVSGCGSLSYSASLRSHDVFDFDSSAGSSVVAGVRFLDSSS